MKQKIGIDIHGCIDKMPKFFSTLTNRLINTGNEIHIITGSMVTPALIRYLEGFNISYTHLFSISDHLIATGHEVKFTSPDNPWFPNAVWNRAKGEYCTKQGINVHFDDSIEYKKYFKKTQFILIKDFGGENDTDNS